MKTHLFIWLLIVGVWSNTAAQPITPKQHQTDYFIQQYHLSQEQIPAYINMRASLDAQSEEINKTATSEKIRSEQLQRVYANFRDQLSGFLSPEQFKNWKSQIKKFSHFYLKEDLQISSDQLRQLKTLTDAMMAEKEVIRNKVLAYAEKRVLYKDLNSKFDTQVNNVLGKEIAAHYLTAYRTDLEARRMMNKYHNTLTYSHAMLILQLEHKYDSEVKRIKASHNSKSQANNAIDQVTSDLEKAIQASVSQEVFQQWEKMFNPSIERKMALNYAMNTSQIAAYKKLLNNRVLNEYKIKHTPLSKEEKRIKINELENLFVKTAEEVIPPQKYQLWLANRKYEQNQKLK